MRGGPFVRGGWWTGSRVLRRARFIVPLRSEKQRRETKARSEGEKKTRSKGERQRREAKAGPKGLRSEDLSYIGRGKGGRRRPDGGGMAGLGVIRRLDN